MLQPRRGSLIPGKTRGCGAIMGTEFFIFDGKG